MYTSYIRCNLKLKSLSELDDIPVDVSSLNISYNELTNLNGIEKFTQLLDLFAIDNLITDISALNKLTNLRCLYLSNNQIESVETLKNLTNLRRLSIFQNKIIDIKPLFRLRQLDCLLTGNNPLTLSRYPSIVNGFRIGGYNDWYKYKLSIVRLDLMMLILRTKIKILWTKFLDRKNKDGISILCFLSLRK